MAKVSMIVKSQRKPKYKVQQHNRCKLCGRPRAYMRKFGLCLVLLAVLIVSGSNTAAQPATASNATSQPVNSGSAALTPASVLRIATCA